MQEQFHKSLKGTVNAEIISHKYLFPLSPVANWGTKTPAEEKQVTVQKPFWLLAQKIINEQGSPNLMQN